MWIVDDSKAGQLEVSEGPMALMAACLGSFVKWAFFAGLVVGAFAAIEVVGRSAVDAAPAGFGLEAIVAMAILAGVSGAVYRAMRRRTWTIDTNSDVIALSVGSRFRTPQAMAVDLDELERVEVLDRRWLPSEITAIFSDARDVMFRTGSAEELADLERVLRSALKSRGIPVVRFETNRGSKSL